MGKSRHHDLSRFCVMCLDWFIFYLLQDGCRTDATGRVLFAPKMNISKTSANRNQVKLGCLLKRHHFKFR